MTKFRQLVLGAAVAMALSAPVLAAPINVGGVIWDPDSPVDFNSTSGSIFQNAGAIPLTGFGRIDFINTDPQSTFCPGCELTFEFGGFVPLAPFPNALGAYEYAGGFVNVYVDNSPDFALLAGTGYNDGVLWLSMTSASIFGSSALVTNVLTTLLGTIGDSGATGVGLLNVTGGLAKNNFDTNSRFGGADVEFQNSFTRLSQFTIGSGNFAATTIPEPASVALLGLGLLGMGALRRRKA